LKGLEIPSSNVDARAGMSPREFREKYVGNPEKYRNWYLDNFNEEPDITALEFYETFMMDSLIEDINEFLRNTGREVEDDDYVTRRTPSFEHYVKFMPNLDVKEERIYISIKKKRNIWDNFKGGVGTIGDGFRNTFGL